MNETDPRPIATIKLLTMPTATLFDSGATHSAISEITATRLETLGIQIHPSNFHITDVQKKTLHVLGDITLPVTINGCVNKWKFLVIRDLDNACIIGADFMKKHNVCLDMKSKRIVFADNIDDLWTRKTLTPVNRTFIPENHHVKIQCTIQTPDNVILHPGSLVITKHNEAMDGVYLEESITKVLRQNRIYIVVTNTNPYPVFLKTSQTIGEIFDTSSIKVLPVHEATIASFGHTTGPIAQPDEEKLQFLKDNFYCPPDTPANIRDKYEKLILQNHDVFASNKFDLGFSDAVSHQINMKTAQPVYVKQFRIPDCHETEILNHVREWQKQEVIEECSSPYNSPVFCVPKKGGGLRIVQDLREINKASYIDKYAIKDVQECVDAIGKSNSKIFSTMDMASGFWQQELTQDSRDYTAFTIPLLNTQFRWKRTVMGLQGAPASFSRLTALVFRGIINAITYIDDLLTHTMTHEEQLLILQQCFDRMRQFNMKFNIKKCVFGATSVTYLGFQLSEHGVSPATDKIEAIQKFKAPTTLKEVRAFIGFCNYFRGMIPNFSRRSAPLISLTKKDSGWSAGILPTSAQQSFDDLKSALGRSPVIGFSRSGGQYILTVDAATTGLGAILTQVNEGVEKVISYWSRTLREHEQNYTPYMLEMTAVCSALEHFHDHVYGRKVIVYTDHRPLIGMSTIQKKTINRLVENMNIYQIDLRYKQGCENQGADYLSRNATTGICSITHHDRFGNIRTQQQEDPVVNGVRVFLEYNAVPQTKNLAQHVLTLASRCFLNDGIVWFIPAKSSKNEAVLLTPTTMVPTILANAHGHKLSGHWAAERTLQRIGASYYWSTMSRDVTEFIRNCGPCQHANRPPKNAALTPWPATSKPNERVHIDLFGPLRGDPIYKYVAVITDAFSKWTEVVPLPDKEATTVAKAVFEEWMCRRGLMIQIISDGGKEFANNLLDELCKLMNVDKHVVTAYHPMANGQVERFNRDMRKYLMTMLDDTANWVEFLKPLQFAHNTSVSKSTKFTPHYFTFLEDARLPDTLRTPNVTYSSSYSADAFRRMQYAYRMVYENNTEARQVYTDHFNRKTKTRHFEIGDEVLVSFPIDQKITNKKLASIWKGPFSIIEVRDNNIVDVKSSPRHKTIRVHTNRIRFFHHFEDIAVEQPQVEIPPLPQSTLTLPTDDDNDGEPITQANEENPVQPQQPPQPPPIQPPAPIAPAPEEPPQPVPLPARDRLAQEIFGRPARQRRPPNRLGDWEY